MMQFFLKKDFLKRAHRTLSLVVVAMLAMPWAVFADNVVTDGDGAAPFAVSSLNFGSVCPGSTTTKPVLLAIRRQGSSGPQVFPNSTTVTVSLIGVSPSSGALSTTPTGTVGTIQLPSTWADAANNSFSAQTVTSQVTLVAPATGSISGPLSVTYRATGGTVTRETPLTVTASIASSGCDSAPPVITVPSDITAEATGPNGAVVTYSATAFDVGDNSSRPVSCTPASGSTFPLGPTTVKCSSSDTTGNSTDKSFKVTVVDTTAPTISGAPDITGVEATGATGAAVTYTSPSASDLVDGSRPVSCTPTSGSTFPLGSTTVSCSASDTSGHTATKTFTVTVVDTTGPVLVLPADFTAEATGPAGAAVPFSTSASDVVDGDRPVNCTPASGSTFPLGPTTVTCSSSDTSSNSTSGSFKVTVVDTTPPVISSTTNQTAEATGPNGAAVTYTAPTASDLVSGTVPVNCAPASGTTFPLGETTVTCSASDAASNSASTSFKVTVVDTTPPVLTLPADQKINATGTSGAEATFSASATDLVSGNASVTCTPASGTTFPIGITTVTCKAKDGAGNEATGSFTIQVTYELKGFSQPADPSPRAPTTIVWNTIKGGSTVPLKFEVFAGSTELTSTSVVDQPSSAKYDCTSGTEDVVEITSTGSTVLRYDTTAGQFIYNWQTPKEAGRCYKVTIAVKDGSTSEPGSSITAYFKLK